MSKDYLSRFWDFDVPLYKSSFENYKIITVLYQSEVGKVYLTEKDGEKYILKELSKDALKQFCSEYNVKDEVELHYELTKLNCKNIVKLLDYFVEIENIYLVLEYCIGGDLFYFLQNKTTHILTETLAKKYVRDISKALKCCHDNNIIHRDVKLENVLIARDGIKLADFGLSTKLQSKTQRVYGLIGTIPYLSPEITEGKSYSFKTDVWSLGILTYELLIGKDPFTPNINVNDKDIDEIEQVHNLVMNLEYEVPDSISNSARRFIYNCLDREEHRMDIDQVLLSEWLTKE